MVKVVSATQGVNKVHNPNYETKVEYDKRVGALRLKRAVQLALRDMFGHVATSI